MGRGRCRGVSSLPGGGAQAASLLACLLARGTGKIIQPAGENSLDHIASKPQPAPVRNTQCKAPSLALLGNLGGDIFAHELHPHGLATHCASDLQSSVKSPEQSKSPGGVSGFFGVFPTVPRFGGFNGNKKGNLQSLLSFFGGEGHPYAEFSATRAMA